MRISSLFEESCSKLVSTIGFSETVMVLCRKSVIMINLSFNLTSVTYLPLGMPAKGICVFYPQREKFFQNCRCRC